MKIWITLIAGGLCGIIIGAGGMLIAFPFIFPPPEVNEKVSAMAVTEEILTTPFREGVDGQDGAHWGRGDVKVYRGASGNYVLEIQDNFEVGPGPNFWIYLNTAADIDNEADFQKDAARKKIAKLKSFRGSQVYHINEADYESAGAVTIWCESFGQYIASANLENAA